MIAAYSLIHLPDEICLLLPHPLQGLLTLHNVLLAWSYIGEASRMAIVELDLRFVSWFFLSANILVSYKVELWNDVWIQQIHAADNVFHII